MNVKNEQWKPDEMAYRPDGLSVDSKREWVGLTKEEFFKIYNSPVTIIKQMSMIEAKLKEKNT
jgi:hypothetical protein